MNGCVKRDECEELHKDPTILANFRCCKVIKKYFIKIDKK